MAADGKRSSELAATKLEQSTMFTRHESTTVVDLLEALYNLEQTRAAWFRGVLKAASAAFDCGAGVGLALYDISGAVPRMDAMDAVNVDARGFALGHSLHQRPSLFQAIIASYRRPGCVTMAEQVPDPGALQFARERYADVGLSDQLLINGPNHRTGLGCALYVFSRSPINLSEHERALMDRISAHLAAAYRLQRQLEQQPSGRGIGVDAVLRTDGRIEHAESAAKSKLTLRDLSEAVKAREWAKTVGGRRDSQRATGAWRPLVGARWSLVDSYERNGLRYITARENVPAPLAIATLSLRERQVGSLAAGGYSNKLIAYELGLAHSTVRVLLARAAVKLGARTRAELIQKLQTQAPSLAGAARAADG